MVGSAVDQATAAVQDKWSVYQDQRAGIPAACESGGTSPFDGKPIRR
ncbi:MAG: hypothetical protein ACYDAG_17290 [Chloroflexota bacterium]